MRKLQQTGIGKFSTGQMQMLFLRHAAFIWRVFYKKNDF